VYDIPPIPAIIEFPFHDRICRWNGTVSRFGGTGIDLSTRTIPCRVLVDDPIHSMVFTLDGQPAADIVPPPLATGMFVSVRIPVTPKTRMVSVPSNAVRSGGVVWLKRDDKLKIQPVKIARRLKERVLLHVEQDGVQAEDRVITSPLAVAENGMAVREQPLP
jgi:multidrug efflux pump subunit AcrA (membrane-fusion protein)